MSSPSRPLVLLLVCPLFGLGCAIDGGGLLGVEAGADDPGTLTGDVVRPRADGGEAGAAATSDTRPGDRLDGATVSGPGDDAAKGVMDGPRADSSVAVDTGTVSTPDTADPADTAPAVDTRPPVDVLPVDAAAVGGGLVAHWKFDDGRGALGAFDSSRNGNSGALFMLDPEAAWIGGHVAGALWIGTATSALGKNQAVLVPRSPSLDAITHSFTIATWVKKNVARGTTYRTIISRPSAGAEPLFSLGFQDGKLLFQATRLGSARALTDAIPPLTEWGHVAVTCDGQSIRMYIDGAGVQEEAQVKSNPTLAPIGLGAPIFIGAEREGATLVNVMDGYLDDLRIYDRALSAGEIKTLAAP